MENSVDELYDSIGFRLHISYLVLREKFTKLIKPFDIAPEQYGTLKIIKQGGSISLSNLAEILKRNRGTITRMVDSLEKKGLVKRVPSKSDRRECYVEISDDGERLFLEVEEVAFKAKGLLDMAISQEEKRLLFEILDKISQVDFKEIR